MIISVNSSITSSSFRFDSIFIHRINPTNKTSDMTGSITLPKELQGKIPSFEDFTLRILPGRIEIHKGEYPCSSMPFEVVHLNTLTPLSLSSNMVESWVKPTGSCKFVIEDMVLKLVYPFNYTPLLDFKGWVKSSQANLKGMCELLEPCLNIVGQAYGKIDMIKFINIWDTYQIVLWSGNNKWITLPLTRWLSDMDEVAYLSFLLNGEIYRLLEGSHDTD